MAKEFKDFDKMFKKGSDKDLNSEQLAEAQCITHWKYNVDKWSNEQIRFAVYNAGDSALDWQKFRVSLKGQSTRVKLWRLEQRLVQALQVKDTLEICRIDNYIGALVRGGQLNTKLEVVR